MNSIFDKCSQENFGFFHEIRKKGKFFLPKLSFNPETHRFYYNDKPVTVWSHNDYLSLSAHPLNRQIEKEVINTYFSNYPMGSRFLTGNCSEMNCLEKEFSSFLEKEDALIFATGYLATIGIIPALAHNGDILILDSESHACIYDASKIAAESGAKVLIFKHNNMESLEKKLKIAQSEPNTGVLIVVEGVYSMSGDVAPLKSIVELKKKYGAGLLVDDAHGIGTMGHLGKGSCFAQEVDDVDLILMTFSKAFGSSGGLVAGRADIIDYLKYNSKTNIFSHNMSLLQVKKALNSLHIIKSNPEILDKLWFNVNHLQSLLKAKGFNIGTTQSSITPVFIKKHPEMPIIEYMSRLIFCLLEEFNIFVSGVTYPAVAKDVFMLRLIPTVNHSQEDVEKTVDALAKTIEHLK